MASRYPVSAPGDPQGSEDGQYCRDMLGLTATHSSPHRMTCKCKFIQVQSGKIQDPGHQALSKTSVTTRGQWLPEGMAQAGSMASFMEYWQGGGTPLL